MTGRLTDKTDRQTEIATKRDSTKRGWETKGGTSKTKGAEQRQWAARVLSLVLTDESQSSVHCRRITEFGCVEVTFYK